MLKSLIRLAVIEVIFIVLGILSGSVRTFFGDTSLVWRSLGTPPVKAIRVVNGDSLSVRVQTVQGQTYFCHWHSPKKCWIHDDQSSYSSYATSDSPFGLRSYREPPPLHGVVDARKFYNMPSEYKQVLSIYAITENGKIYVWQAGLLDLFDPLIYSAEGILVALLCGLVFWRFIEWRVRMFQHSVQRQKQYAQ